MIVATCFLIGVSAGMTRSGVSMAVTAFLIAMTFAVASLVSMSSVPLWGLGLSIAGFNAGLIAYVSGGLLMSYRGFGSAR